MNLGKNQDTRLLEAFEWIDSETIDFVSIDIFDTLLWRMVPSPQDLFLILGRRLYQEGWLIPAAKAENFAELRITAEQAARDEKEFALGRTEVTLSEIYWQLTNLFVTLSTEEMLQGNKKGIYASDVKELVNLEIALESELIQLDLNIFRLILYAFQKKIPVILVSDTYFEEPQLSKLIDRACSFHGHIPISFTIEQAQNLSCQPISTFSDCIHSFYLSSDFGMGKREGLFTHMLNDLKIEPSRILHIGDNWDSDILPAQEAGVRTVHYPKSTPFFDEILEREWGSESCTKPQFLDNIQGDFGITSIRTKIVHQATAHDVKKEERFFWEYGAMVLGPVLFGFIYWIYDRCAEMQEESVYCLMREGKLYANLIQRLAPYYHKHKLKTQQLWVSRLFITHASLSTAHKKELLSVMNAFLEQFTIEDFCSYLGLDITEMHKWINYRHVILEDRDLRKEFILYLVSKEAFREKIIVKASDKRKRFFKYLLKLCDSPTPSRMILVDVGWNGSAQGAMHKILQLEGSGMKLHGLYLGTTQAANVGLLHGIIREGYLFRGGYPSCGNAHKKGCFVLEQTATAETGLGSLQDIDEQGKITTSPLLIPERQKRQAHSVQQGIFAFFDMLGPYIKSGAIKWNSKSEELHNQLRAIFLRSMIYTTQMEAVKFGSWYHEHGPAAKLTQIIGKNAYYERHIKDMLPIAAFKENGLNWPAAYAAKNSKYLTLTSQAMWLNTLPPQCFLSEDHFSLRIFLDTGSNFPKKAHKHVLLQSNPNRNFYSLVKIFSPKKRLKRIMLMLSFPKALVRIKSLRMIAYDYASPEPQNFIFFETPLPTSVSPGGGFGKLSIHSPALIVKNPGLISDRVLQASDAQPGLEILSKEQMDINTFYCDDHLKLIHDFEKNSIYQIKVKLCCEMFKL